MMEQDSFLQRRQSIDVLDVGNPSRSALHNKIDVLLGQIDQRQHRGCNDLGVRLNHGGRNGDFTMLAQVSSQFTQYGRGKQTADFQIEIATTQPFDQLHRQ